TSLAPGLALQLLSHSSCPNMARCLGAYTLMPHIIDAGRRAILLSCYVDNFASEIKSFWNARPGFRVVGGAILVILSTMVGMAVSWRAPGLEIYSRDWMMRWRGGVTPPGEIVVVAIDEASIARFGRFPWPRRLMARALDKISAARPRCVALDVLYTDPS